ncbi:MAG: hypothetical protein HC883_00310 [Bdellovibrionaceae bacterium]|nr:hypothetical protein [Pseudobdellovibrionaceae bacterium]
MSIVPRAKPEISYDECVEMGRDNRLDVMTYLMGIRGFFNPGANERGVYDDALVIVDPLDFLTFNANTDPSRLGRGLASLKAPQICYYRMGIHNITKEPIRRYEALVQAAPVTVLRDGLANVDRGWFGINIHRGGVNTPGSEGCQTLPPDQWVEFINKIRDILHMRKMKEIPYLIVEV